MRATDFLVEHQNVIAILILAATFCSLLFERFPPAVVAIGGAAVFMLFGYVSTDDVMKVFSGPSGDREAFLRRRGLVATESFIPDFGTEKVR